MTTPPTQNVAGAGCPEPEAVRALEVERPVRRQFSSPLRGVRACLAGTSRRRATTAVGSIAIAALAIGIILATEPAGSSQGASTRESAGGTTTVQYRDLISTDTESGTLGYANPQTVFNRFSGTITSLPKVGQVIKPGQALYEVDSQPVILMAGTTPAYRDLTSADSGGADILQLNRDLRSLGFDPEHLIKIDDVWRTATSTAVEAWQASLGETETGAIILGQIVFLPGAQRITAADAALGSTGGFGGSASGAAGSGSGPINAGDSPSSSGGGAEAILQTTSNHVVVTVDLDATKQSEAVVGEPVTVQLPSGNTVAGKITQVSPVAQSGSASSTSSSSGSGSSSAPSVTVPVTIQLTSRHRLAGLDQATVSVNFQQQEQKHVLSVPVSALLATAGGGYTIQQATAPHRLIAVTPGLFAAGYVQVSGAQLDPGLQVTDSQG
jgi:hypothetical protein